MIHLVLSDLLSQALGILLEGKKKVKGKKPFTQETVLEKATEKEKNFVGLVTITKPDVLRSYGREVIGNSS